jgi:hypothetical protein
MDIDTVLDAVASRVESLNLSLGGNAIPVAKGKHPRQGEGEGANTQVMVCPARDPRAQRRFTSRHDLETYRVRVALWTPGNHDNTANLTELAAIEDQIQQALDHKPADLLGLDDLRDVRADTALFLDRPAFLDGWDALVTDVELDIVRER